MKGEWKSFHVRPEDTKTALDYYDADESKRYSLSNAMRTIQRKITFRCVQIAGLINTKSVLDAGCGPGFSLDALAELGFEDIAGFDVVPAFVKIAKGRGYKVKLGDLREIPFENESFDGIVSVSSLQWILEHNMKSSVRKCAREFRRVLKEGGRAAIQFYPKSEQQAIDAGRVFRQNGFKVIVITDNPNLARKRKIYLYLEKLGACGKVV
ncbi:class I SAM-dependent methyltransferase [Candidatus Micrarchaeota archaeon]|nr:class I SAM-dependent methyltransferase [Candidatus Micrarchaeota archaeon]